MEVRRRLKSRRGISRLLKGALEAALSRGSWKAPAPRSCDRRWRACSTRIRRITPDTTSSGRGATDVGFEQRSRSSNTQVDTFCGPPARYGGHVIFEIEGTPVTSEVGAVPDPNSAALAVTRWPAG